MTCIKCGEHMEGDGYTTVIYCPNINPDKDERYFAAPDEGPFFCDFEDHVDNLQGG